MARAMQTERRKWVLALTLAVGGWLLTLVGFVWWSATSYAAINSRSSTNETTVADHEARLRAIESRVIEMATDVKWIREHLEGKP